MSLIALPFRILRILQQKRYVTNTKARAVEKTHHIVHKYIENNVCYNYVWPYLQNNESTFKICTSASPAHWVKNLYERFFCRLAVGQLFGWAFGQIFKPQIWFVYIVA